MANDVIDLDSRLRAARPPAADTDANAYDAELLARVREQPIAGRRTVPRALALSGVALVTITAAAVLALGGGPGNVGGPSSASAITQALHWLDPPSGTILHARSVETRGGQTTTREVWQSADQPESERQRFEGATTFEIAGEALYDPATNTIYDAPPGKRPGKPGDETSLVADPIVVKVRTLLEDGHMTVTGREVHNGTEAWAISLKPDLGRPVWTLWVSAENGKPLELRDPGRDASEQPQAIRWPTYEVLPDANADALLTLTGAHPTARVVHDDAQAAAAARRLLPDEF
jgi:hypothetical protein